MDSLVTLHIPAILTVQIGFHWKITRKFYHNPGKTPVLSPHPCIFMCVCVRVVFECVYLLGCVCDIFVCVCSKYLCVWNTCLCAVCIYICVRDVYVYFVRVWLFVCVRACVCTMYVYIFCVHGV